MIVQSPRSLRRCKSPVYMLRHLNEGDPRSYAVSVLGSKFEPARAVKVSVSLSVLPSVMLPLLWKLPVTTVVSPRPDPILTFVVDPASPPVPRLTVLVAVAAVAPVIKLYVDEPVEAVAKFIVCANVALFAIFSDVAAPAMLNVVAF